LGPGLGRLCEHVRGADRDGADVQRPDRLLAWQKGLLRW
jgi:hypothetical protein